MTKVVGVLEIEPVEMVSETSYSSRDLGKHASTMTLYADGSSYFIEWDVPTLDETEIIGVWFEHKTLRDYDGVFSLPAQAVTLLKQCGFEVPAEFIDGGEEEDGGDAEA